MKMHYYQGFKVFRIPSEKGYDNITAAQKRQIEVMKKRPFMGYIRVIYFYYE